MRHPDRRTLPARLAGLGRLARALLAPGAAAALAVGAAGTPPQRRPPAVQPAAPLGAAGRVVANDNRTPAGRMVGDTLVLRLTVTLAAWHLLGDAEPGFTLLAFAEEGKPPTIPGPLIRVRVGTPVRVTLRNPLDDTLVVRGLGARAAALDSVVVLPGDTATVAYVPRHAGTYLYQVPTYSLRIPDTLRSASLPPRGYDSQLAGALVVDPPGRVPDDRVLVLTQLADRNQEAAAADSRDRHGTLTRQFSAINGVAWPHTERLRHAVGDSVRWRIVNAGVEAHPMHLHGFYFRVDAHGTPQTAADSLYAPEQRRMAVTETVAPRHTTSIVWSPDRPGGWLFHCHLTNHAVKFAPMGRRDVLDYPSTHHDGDPDRHALTGMNGLVLGVTVTGRAPAPVAWRPAKRLRLLVQSDSQPGDRDRRFGYVLQRGAEPRRDSVEYPGPVLVLTRGEATSIVVENRAGEPTAVHWHGIELESYYDGVVGWSGTPGGRTTPAIRPGQRFEVRITPARAGTFMYHTHLDELRQQYGGLVGALVVLEPGETWDPTRDLMLLLSDGVPGRIYVNGSLTPAPKQLEVGKTYRLRLADIAVFRQALRVQLVRDSVLLAWRPIAKDGFTLPDAQATMRPSAVNLPSGETADFAFTPDRPGELALEVVGPGAQGVQARVRLLVSPAAPAAEPPRVRAAPNDDLRADLRAELQQGADKIVALAGAMPPAAWDWRPGAGVRSTREVFAHVAAESYYAAAKFGGRADAASGVTGRSHAEADSAERRLTTSAQLPAELERSLRVMVEAFDAIPAGGFDATTEYARRPVSVRTAWVRSATHLHEHLGQLVAYARASSVVPPWSR